MAIREPHDRRNIQHERQKNVDRDTAKQRVAQQKVRDQAKAANLARRSAIASGLKQVKKAETLVKTLAGDPLGKLKLADQAAKILSGVARDTNNRAYIGKAPKDLGGDEAKDYREFQKTMQRLNVIVSRAVVEMRTLTRQPIKYPTPKIGPTVPLALGLSVFAIALLAMSKAGKKR